MALLDDGRVGVGVGVAVVGRSVSVGVALGVVEPPVGVALDGRAVTAAGARRAAVTDGTGALACVEEAVAGADVVRWTAGLERAPGVLMCSPSPSAAVVSGARTTGSLGG
jgi:malate/lactate dehydrogenase